MEKFLTPIESIIAESCSYNVVNGGSDKSACYSLVRSLYQRGFLKLKEDELRLSLRLLIDYEKEPTIDLYVAFQCNQVQFFVHEQIDKAIGCHHPLEK